MLKPIFRWRGSMVGDGVELVGVSQTGDLVGVELEDEIPGGGNGTLKVQKYFYFSLVKTFYTTLSVILM